VSSFLRESRSSAVTASDFKVRSMTEFNSHIGMDYPGAETVESSSKGLRVYVAEYSVCQNNKPV